jgi:ABC-2 type transport system permease protein
VSWRERPTILVAERELREATRARSFRISVVISAAALAAVIVIANLAGDDERSVDVVVAGADAAEVAPAVVRVGDAVGIVFETTTVADDEAARAAVDDGDADVAVLTDGAALVTDEPVDLSGGSTLATAVNALRADLALENGLRAVGLAPEEAAEVRATQPPPVDSLQPAEANDDGSRTGVALITNILLFIMLQTYGSWVLTAVTREKESRVIEVLLAVIRPKQLLIGKTAGIGTVAFAHAAALIAVAFVTTRIVGADITGGLRAGDLVIGAVWFMLGYALYCGVFAAAGALCARVEDAQAYAFPIMLPLLFGYLVSFSAADGANTLLWVLAFIPPTAVLAMPSLYAIDAAPLWAVALSMAITAVTIVVVANVAAKIYERSVLRTGRKVKWREAFRARAEIDSADPAITAA